MSVNDIGKMEVMFDLKHVDQNAFGKDMNNLDFTSFFVKWVIITLNI